MSRHPASYAEFWPDYLAAHEAPATRACHYLGTGLGLLLLLAGIVLGDWRLVVGALLVGYGFAWLGHLVFERNRPATLSHPLWSFASDFRMLALFLAVRLAAERKRSASARETPRVTPSPPSPLKGEGEARGGAPH